MIIYPLNKFRRLKEFSKVFKINEDTVIAYDGNIYSNKPLHPDVLEHEKVHLRQQKEHGLLNFTDKYLNNRTFRLEMEAEAYKVQLESIKDEGLREAVRKDIIIGLCSGLYGKMSKKEAEKLLPQQPKKLDVHKLV
jgi:hypothetical protein